MRARIDKLVEYINSNQDGRLSDIFIAINGLVRDNLWLDRREINNGFFSKAMPNDSELQRHEECDAIAFLVAIITHCYSSDGDSSTVVLDAALIEFINKIIQNDLNTKEHYPEAVYWGLQILNQYILAKKDKTAESSAFVAAFEKQKFLKQVATPKIFEERPPEDKEYKDYQEDLRQEKILRYQTYVAYKQIDRTQLKSRLKRHQLHKKWGTVACFIPGVFWFKEGFSGAWSLLMDGKPLFALRWFLLSAVVSALSPVSALGNYYLYDTLEKITQKKIAKYEKNKDLIVTRTYTSTEYEQLRAFRKSLKEDENNKKIINENPSSRFNKPKKYVQNFTDQKEEKVRVFMDREQAARLDDIQKLKRENNKDASRFFQQLNASKQKSVDLVQEFHRKYEQH